MENEETARGRDVKNQCGGEDGWVCELTGGPETDKDETGAVLKSQ